MTLGNFFSTFYSIKTRHSKRCQSGTARTKSATVNTDITKTPV